MKKLLVVFLTCYPIGIGALAQPTLHGEEVLIDLTDQAQISQRRPILIAHRGGIVRDDSPECSLSAIRLAAEAGYAMVELDVQRSRDEIPMVFHDTNLKKACGVEGRVEQYSSAELVKLQYHASDQKIVRLETALALCRELNLGVMLDLKAGLDSRPFLRKIDQLIVVHSLVNSTICISGSPTARKALRHVIFGPTSDQMAQFRNGQKVDLRGTFWFGLPSRLPSADVARLQACGAFVFPAINTFRYPRDRHREMALIDIKRLVAAGVDGFQIDSVYANAIKKE